jgi:hypothetical protein
VSETVIGGTFIGVGEYFIGLVDFLELLFGSVSTVMVGVVLKG